MISQQREQHVCEYCNGKVIPLMQCCDDEMATFGGFQNRESGLWFHIECHNEVLTGKQ